MKNFTESFTYSTISKTELSSCIQQYNSEQNKSLIFYDADKSKNYAKTMRFLEHISPSKLKYSRKKEVIVNNTDYKFNMSDCHIEIDFELLGVNETNVFIEIYNQITSNKNIMNTNLIIVCLNFEHIRKELLKIMYSFMNDEIKFFFLVDQISFFPVNILENSYIKRWNRENKKIVCKVSNPDYNIESLKTIMNDSNLLQTNDNKLLKIRTCCYEYLVKNRNMCVVLSCLIKECIRIKIINKTNIIHILKQFTHILEKYNNNYRSIFHIENFMYFLINLKDI